MKSIQNFYDDYKGKIDFYIITAEEREPVEDFMAENEFDLPVTYLIIGERAPVDIPEPPASYIIDSEGFIRVAKDGIAEWDNSTVYNLIDELIQP